MRVLALLNHAAGTNNGAVESRREDEIRTAFESIGISPEVRAVDGDQLTATTRNSLDGFDVICAAGGDGTISAIASALAGSGKSIGVLPCGTMNHFAKDLKLPLQLDAAARVIATGNARNVDVAEVNGRVFVNNSSIGLYPRVVKHRDDQMERLGRGKWMAMLVAWLSIFRRYPTVTVRLTDEHGTSITCETPFVFVGNNRYAIDLMRLGGRDALDRGELSVYFTRRTGRWALVRLAIRTLFNRLDQSRDFESATVRELSIETSKSSLTVALDGETMRMRPPLHYRIRPGELRVIVPS